MFGGVLCVSLVSALKNVLSIFCRENEPREQLDGSVRGGSRGSWVLFLFWQLSVQTRSR